MLFIPSRPVAATKPGQVCSPVGSEHQERSALPEAIGRTPALRRKGLVLAVLMLLASASLIATAAENTPPMLNSRQRAFLIPFRVTPAQRPDQKPREVFLYYSVDRGATWPLGGRVDPSAGRFRFQAPADGEYWFVVRTQLQNGKFARQNVSSPGLRVLVDTVQPQIEVSARRTPEGQVEARWRLSDENLDANRFALEYQDHQDGQWKPVPVDATLVNQGDGGLEGTCRWLPPGSPGQIAIRGSVLDRAGNHAMSQAVVNAGPVPETPVTEPQTQTADKSTTITPPSIPPSFTPVTSPTAETQAPLPKTATDSSAGLGEWPPDQTSDVPLMSEESTTPSFQDSQSRLNGQPYRTPPVDQQPETPVSPPTTAQDDFPVMPQTSKERESADVEPKAPDQTATEKSSTAMQPRIVYSSSFQLPYSTTHAGTDSIAKVDLWGTRDGGRTWTYFGTDIDQTSPFEVTVPSFGMYGFRILLHSLGGSRPAVPQAGDLPDVWVLVQDGEPGDPSSGH
jgi:hypothetical protein